MKNLIKLTAAIVVFLAFQKVTMAKDKIVNPSTSHVEEKVEYIPAVRLISKPDGKSTFEKGKIETFKHADIKTFWLSSKTEKWEMDRHVAPRKQYVVTLKGELKFKVSDGSTFILKPGVILLAEDLTGEGHSWEMVKGNKWERLYIPLKDDADDLFIPDSK